MIQSFDPCCNLSLKRQVQNSKAVGLCFLGWVQALLRRHPGWTTGKWPGGVTLLHHAARGGNAEICNTLIAGAQGRNTPSAGPDLADRRGASSAEQYARRQNAEGEDAFLIALKSGHVAAAEALLPFADEHLQACWIGTLPRFALARTECISTALCHTRPLVKLLSTRLSCRPALCEPPNQSRIS